MKKKTVKTSSNKNQNVAMPRCRACLWIVVAVFFGGLIGYATHYTIANWHGFFATCPSGENPDKNGCCNGEIYTDAGDGWMVCCPEGSDNCFPPVK